MCHNVFMYGRRYKNTNSQTNGSVKYISNTYEGMMQNKIYCNYIMTNMYFRVCVRIFYK